MAKTLIHLGKMLFDNSIGEKNWATIYIPYSMSGVSSTYPTWKATMPKAWNGNCENEDKVVYIRYKDEKTELQVMLEKIVNNGYEWG